jgi:hypothetical protein
MAASRSRPERTRQWERRYALLASLMVPLLVLAGLLAPGVVQVMAQSLESDQATERPPLVQTVGPLERLPLLVPRDFSAGFLPELIDLERLFEAQRRRLASSDHGNAPLPSFARHHGDSIVLDDVGPVAEDVAFGDALITGAPTERLLLKADDSLFPLCGVLHAANCVRFDDFASGGGGFSVVPEPSTGLLMAGGLLILALGRRRSRPFPSGTHASRSAATSSR